MRDGPADDGRIGLVAAPPELIGQDGRPDRRPAGRRSASISRPSAGTTPSMRNRPALTAAPATRSGSPPPVSVRLRSWTAASAVEGGRLALPVEEVEIRRRRTIVARGAPHRPEIHEPIGLVERQRLDERRVHDAEHRGVGADAERQAEDGQSRQQRRPGQRANGVANVLRERIHDASCWRAGSQIPCQECPGTRPMQRGGRREVRRLRVSGSGRFVPQAMPALVLVATPGTSALDSPYAHTANVPAAGGRRRGGRSPGAHDSGRTAALQDGASALHDPRPLASDLEGTLKRVAALGYEEVETYGFDRSPRLLRVPANEFAQRLRDSASPLSGHYDLNRFAAGPRRARSLRRQCIEGARPSDRATSRGRCSTRHQTDR